ncbi:hypothetical protein D9615_000058 [Tricholomella constricta]|nr:hypothetical protein D9615_000058 [Tricholomella constricta]
MYLIYLPSLTQTYLGGHAMSGPLFLADLFPAMFTIS